MNKAKTIKTIVMVVACLLVVALLCGFLVVKLKGKAPETSIVTGACDKPGAQVETIESSGIKVMAASIDEEDFEAYGVSEDAESAFTLKATIHPETVANKALSWKVAFTNPSSEWATDKTVTDYVTVTPDAETNTALIECFGAFGEEIKVTATSLQDNSKSAVCKLQYMRRIESIDVVVDNVRYYISNDGFWWVNGAKLGECRVVPDFERAKDATCQVTFNKSEVYTKECVNPEVKFTMTPGEKMLSDAATAGYAASDMKTYEHTFTSEEEETISGFFDRTWLMQLTHNDTSLAAKDKAIYFALDQENYPGGYVITFSVDGEEVGDYGVIFDSSSIIGQIAVSGVSFDQTEYVF